MIDVLPVLPASRGRAAAGARHGTAYRRIDLSVPIQPTPFEAGPLRMRYVDHRRGGDLLGLAARMSHYGSRLRIVLTAFAQVLGIRALRSRDFPEGLGLAWEDFRSLSSHHGTHVDAPWHYGPECAGRPARTIDQLPLDWFDAPGLRIDVRGRRDPAWIRLDDVRSSLDRDSLGPEPGDIVMLQTGMDRFWKTPAYLAEAPGVDPAVVHWLVERGIRVIGIDAFGFDRPFAEMYREFLRTRDPRVLWPTHLAGREMEYCQIEKLANLDALPGATGYQIVCYPVRIEGGSAAWARVVAKIEMPAELEREPHAA
jgi:kynurenine formamidase